MNKILLAVIFLTISYLPAFASNSQCYSPNEVQAEQLLRLHSELMVITVTCAQSSSGDSLVPLYTGFTHTNLSALHQAEQTMMNYYKTNFSGKPVDSLDRLRTRLGNEYGQKIADLSAPEFCKRFRDKVATFYSETPEQVLQESLEMVKTSGSEHPVCGSQDTRQARSGQ